MADEPQSSSTHSAARRPRAGQRGRGGAGAARRANRRVPRCRHRRRAAVHRLVGVLFPCVPAARRHWLSNPTNPLRRPLPDGIVPEDVVARTEKRWIVIMAAVLLVMMAVIVVTGITGALHPSSNVELIDPTTLHLEGEFVESNLGTAVEPDRSVTVRMIADAV